MSNAKILDVLVESFVGACPSELDAKVEQYGLTEAEMVVARNAARAASDRIREGKTYFEAIDEELGRFIVESVDGTYREAGFRPGPILDVIKGSFVLWTKDSVASAAKANGLSNLEASEAWCLTEEVGHILRDGGMPLREAFEFEIERVGRIEPDDSLTDDVIELAATKREERKTEISRLLLSLLGWRREEVEKEAKALEWTADEVQDVWTVCRMARTRLVGANYGGQDAIDEAIEKWFEVVGEESVQRGPK